MVRMQAVAFHRREYVPVELRTPEYLEAQAREQRYGRCEGQVARGFSFGELAFVRGHRNHHNVLATTDANVIKVCLPTLNPDPVRTVFCFYGLRSVSDADADVITYSALLSTSVRSTRRPEELTHKRT
jgi:hypothetical protein